MRRPMGGGGGGGGHLGSLCASGTWPTHQSLWHINRLELEAVALSLEFFPHLRGKPVRFFTDNTMVAFYMNKQGGAHSIPLSIRVEEILLWCQSHHISLSARHIPGKLNIVADAQQVAHGHPDGMDSLPQCPPSGLAVVASPDGGSLCHEVQPPPGGLRFASTRSGGSIVSPLDSPPELCFSPLSSVGESPPESTDRLRVSNPHSPEVASATMLPRSSRSHSRTSLKSLLSPRSGVPHANSQCLDLHAWATVRSSLRSLDASDHTLQLVQDSHRVGTQNVYAAKWDKWISWCFAKHVDPIRPTTVVLANFLSHLSVSQGLGSSTVRGYYSAISTTVKQLGGASQELSRPSLCDM